MLYTLWKRISREVILLCAFFLPAWLSALGGFDYPNESLRSALLTGGGLITFANLVLLLPAARR